MINAKDKIYEKEVEHADVLNLRLIEEDKEKLRSWTYPTAPYSYMVEVYLKVKKG